MRHMIWFLWKSTLVVHTEISLLETVLMKKLAFQMKVLLLLPQ